MIIRPGMASCLHGLCWCFLHVSLAMRAPNSPAAGKSAIMIVSGITSHTELCMAVESGARRHHHNLRSCEAAICCIVVVPIVGITLSWLLLFLLSMLLVDNK